MLRSILHSFSAVGEKRSTLLNPVYVFTTLVKLERPPARSINSRRALVPFYFHFRCDIVKPLFMALVAHVRQPHAVESQSRSLPNRNAQLTRAHFLNGSSLIPVRFYSLAALALIMKYASLRAEFLFVNL